MPRRLSWPPGSHRLKLEPSDPEIPSRRDPIPPLRLTYLGSASVIEADAAIGDLVSPIEPGARSLTWAGVLYLLWHRRPSRRPRARSPRVRCHPNPPLTGCRSYRFCPVFLSLWPIFRLQRHTTLYKGSLSTLVV